MLHLQLALFYTQVFLRSIDLLSAYGITTSGGKFFEKNDFADSTLNFEGGAESDVARKGIS